MSMIRIHGFNIVCKTKSVMDLEFVSSLKKQRLSQFKETIFLLPRSLR